jgi:hypothetical protein
MQDSASWNKVAPLYEYACHKRNYSLYNILEGARTSEAERAAKHRSNDRVRCYFARPVGPLAII